MHTTSMFKQYKQLNDIRVYSIQTYEKKISHDYYCQIVTHEVCDVDLTYERIQQLEKKDKKEEDTKEVVSEKTTQKEGKQVSLS